MVESPLSLETMRFPEIILRSYPDGIFPDIMDIENYRQMNNTCGIASILMLNDIVPRISIKTYLKRLTHILKPLMEELNEYMSRNIFSHEEYGFQVALQYILLKALSPQPYKELELFLKNHLDGLYEDIRAVFIHNIKQKLRTYTHELIQNYSLIEDYELYLRSGYVTSSFLYECIEEFKNDAELKILAAILGFKFVPAKTGDFTGAISFNRDKYDKLKLGELIISYLHPARGIIFGSKNHWLMVSGLSLRKKKDWRLIRDGFPDSLINPAKFEFVVNDPIEAFQDVKLFKELDPDERFYIFEYMYEDLGDLWESIVKNAEEDCKFECNRSAEEIIIEDEVPVEISPISEETLSDCLKTVLPGRSVSIGDKKPKIFGDNSSAEIPEVKVEFIAKDEVFDESMDFDDLFDNVDDNEWLEAAEKMNSSDFNRRYRNKVENSDEKTPIISKDDIFED